MQNPPTDKELIDQTAALRQEISELLRERSTMRANYWRTVDLAQRQKMANLGAEINAFLADAESNLRTTLNLARQRGLL